MLYLHRRGTESTFDDVEFRVIREDDSPVVASWEETGSKYTLYHDSTGEHSRFREDLSDAQTDQDGYLFRMQKVLGRWQALSDHLLDRGGSDSLWGGRPDIVLEKATFTEDGTEELEQFFVGEVKYTTDSDYAAIGLRELLEYMAFVRHAADDHPYVESQNNILESQDVQGLLFVDEIDTKSAHKSTIDIIQFGEDIPPVVR